MVLEVAIIGVAFLCEAVFGFGGGLISIPLLSLLIGVKKAVTLALIFQLGMGLLLIHSYKDVQIKVGLNMGIGMLLGTLVGVFGLVTLPEQVLRIILAIVILSFLLQMFFGKHVSLHLKESFIADFFAGALGGVFQGLIGTGGPVLTLYLMTIGISAASFRATLIFLFFVSSILRIFLSFSYDLFTADIQQTAIAAFPLFLVVLIVGHYSFKRLNERYYRIGVGIILFVAAIFMLLK